MNRILAAVTALCAFLLPTASGAQEATVHEAFRSTQGCIYYLARISGNPPGDPGQRTWSGSCTPGQPINGTGALMWTQDDDVRGGFSGRMVNGSWDGQIINHIEMFFDGAWHGDEGDGMVINFNMGCVATYSQEECQPAAR